MKLSICLLAILAAANIRAAMIQPKITAFTAPSAIFTPSAADTDFADDLETSRTRTRNALRVSEDVSSTLGAHHQLSQLASSERGVTNLAKYCNDVAYSHSLTLDDEAKATFLDTEINQVDFGTSGLTNPDCSSCASEETGRFRSASGLCNNINNCNWGTPTTSYRRLLPATYGENGEPLSYSSTSFGAKDSCFGGEDVLNDRGLSVMVMQWGQYIAHDVSATPTATVFNSSGIPLEVNCCSNPEYSECVTFESAENCHSFIRSAPGLIDRGGVYSYGQREQMNMVTAFIDGSPTYGSRQSDMNNLKDSATGKLRIWDNEEFEFPPTDADQYCDGRGEEKPSCFIAGDTRPNVHLGMMLTHTVLLREHNSIIDEIDAILDARGRTWTAKKKFNEARRILGAYLQVITYEQYLPLIIGDELMTTYGLNLDSRTAYDSSVDPSVFNSFSTAAYRMGHSQIYDNFKMASHLNGALVNPIPLSELYFNPDRPYHHSGIVVRRYVLGMIYETTNAVDANFVPDISEPLMFVSTDRVSESRLTIGLDLAALNIQRGRDHGLPKYSEWTTHIDQYDSTPITYLDGSDFSIYGDAGDADLFVGGMLETHLADAEVGKTFGHIIALQFRNLMYGDRYFYNHDTNVDSAYSFTDEQVTELKKIRISQIVCRNANMTDNSVITDDVFHVISETNPLLNCDDVKLNYPNIETLISDQL